MVVLFDFKSDKHFVASSDRTNLKIYQLTNPTTHPSSIRKTHWREIANINYRDDNSDDDDMAADQSQLEHYDGLLFFDGHGKIEGREALTKLAQHLTRLHLMVSPGGYCFQDATELDEYKNFGIHYLRLNDLFDWSRHGVDFATTAMWQRLKLKYNVPKQEKPSKPTTSTTKEGGISKEKHEELKRLVKEKDEELGKLRDEMEEELQKLREEKDEELQNLREEMEKASEAKDGELRKLRKEKDEELRMLRKGKNEGATLQKLRKEKGEELRKLRSEMEEEMEKLRREKDEEVEEVEKVKEEETMKKLGEKDDELRKLRKEKDEELRKLLRKKESELQMVKKGKNEELEKLRNEMEEEMEKLRKEKDEEVEKIEKEKEREISENSDKKDEEKRKFQNEKEELQKLLKKKDDELKNLRKVKDDGDKDVEANDGIKKKEADDTSRKSSEKDDELPKTRNEGDEIDEKMRKKEKQMEDMEKMKDDELKKLRGELSSSLGHIARLKEELKQCREKSWSDSDRKTNIFVKLQLTEDQQWQIHLRQRRPVPPATFRCERIDTYSGYRYLDMPKIKDGQTNFFCETSLLVNEEMTARSLLPPLTYVETRVVGQFDVNNWWFTKALHREGGVTMLAYYDGDRDRVRVSMPKIERPVRLPYSKYEDVYSDRRFFLTRVGTEIRLAFAYRE